MKLRLAMLSAIIITAVWPFIPAAANHVDLKHGDITDWFVNDERGLEHGFTVTTSPDSSSDSDELSSGQLAVTSAELTTAANIPALAPQDVGPTVVATVTVGSGPYGVGVNPTTNRVYVTNVESHTVSVIDGASNTVIATLPVGSNPDGVDVDPTTNRIYVANRNSNNVSVIDGASNVVVATVPVGTTPRGVGVNPTTNRIYVANWNSNTVSVIDGASNVVVATVPVGSYPYGVGINPTTNRIYVTNCANSTVSVIDGASNTVVATLPVGNTPDGVGANPTTNRIYVANISNNSVSVIDGASNTIVATVTVGGGPSDVGVNPTTNRVYVANQTSNNVSVIDGASNAVVATVPVGSLPYAVDVNPTTHHIYVANQNSNTVSVIQDELALTKSVSPAAARPSEAITYTITFSNTEAITATNVVITDELSANITGANFTHSGAHLTQVPGSRYVWTAPDLLQGQGGVITITGVLTKPLAAGTFINTVTLAVSGTVKTANALLTVQNVAPAADAGPDQGAGVDNTVTLDGSGGDDNGDVLTSRWTQTGGSPTVTLINPAAQSSTFTAPASAAVLTFTLTVTDTGGLTDTDEVVITVTEGVPGFASTPVAGSTIDVGMAEVGSPATTMLTISETGKAMLSVTSHSLSGPNAADFSVSPATLSIPNGGAAQPLYIRCTLGGPGLRTAILTVNHNAAGSPATYTLNCVDVPIAGLQARSSSPTNFGRTTTFTATTTAGTNIDYAWQFGDGQMGSGTTVTHTYSLTGTFVVTVTASNSRSSQVAATTALVNVSIVHANFAATPLSGEAPLTITFTNASSGDYVSALWNFGDGQTSAELNPTHAYAPGDYTVTLTITGFDTSDVLIKSNYLHFTRKPTFIYLPIIANRWPPVPYNPTLTTISNADGDSNFDVSWTEYPTRLAVTYTLQEATNAAFTTGLREACTIYNQVCTIGGRVVGTYFYRVRGHNVWGYGGWSSIQSAVVNRVELIVNGDFESGPPAAPWVQYSSMGELIYRVLGAHSGDYAVFMGGGLNEYDRIYQVVSIPINAPSVRLSYWRSIITDEFTQYFAYDTMKCKIWDTNGNELASCGQYSNLDHSSWKKATFDMSAFRGQTIRIGFIASSDSTYPTNFFVDDVSLADSATSSQSNEAAPVSEDSDSHFRPLAFKAFNDSSYDTQFFADDVSLVPTAIQVSSLVMMDSDQTSRWQPTEEVAALRLTRNSLRSMAR